jgi:hydroxymethylpyrimidine pyrophosphatase-like HAD family hydrolase
MDAQSKNFSKIIFLDIDGVLTPSAEFIPGESPILTKESINVLKKFAAKGFFLVFITARGVSELRLKNGFEQTLKKSGLLGKSLIYGSTGLDQATYGNEFKLNENSPVLRNGNMVLVKKAIIKRETFSDLDKFLLYKMLLGREIKQQLKYKGIKLKPARVERISTDARFFFEIENNTIKEREKAVLVAKEVVAEQREIYKTTGKFGSPVDLSVYDIVAGISIEPTMLGKHFGVLRALKQLQINPKDKIIGYAFGDNDSDSKMRIRKDIEFIKVKNNRDFVKQCNQILKRF